MKEALAAVDGQPAMGKERSERAGWGLPVQNLDGSQVAIDGQKKIATNSSMVMAT